MTTRKIPPLVCFDLGNVLVKLGPTICAQVRTDEHDAAAVRAGYTLTIGPARIPSVLRPRRGLNKRRVPETYGWN